MVDDNRILINLQHAVVHLADADASYIFIVINRADEHLRICVRVAGGRRDIVDDRLEERGHIPVLAIRREHCVALPCRCVNEGAVKLLVGGIKVHEKLKHLVHNLCGACLGAVDLIDADDDREL